jgi:prephenate dehydrogenase
MNQTVVIIGIGEMGGVFAKGFLRSGYPVYPNHKCVGRWEIYAHQKPH